MREEKCGVVFGMGTMMWGVFIFIIEWAARSSLEM